MGVKEIDMVSVDSSFQKFGSEGKESNTSSLNIPDVTWHKSLTGEDMKNLGLFYEPQLMTLTDK